MNGARWYAGSVYASAMLVPAFLLFWIVPKFELIYTDMLAGQLLPTSTLWVLRLSSLVRQYGWFLAAGLLAASVIYIVSARLENPEPTPAATIWPAMTFLGLIIPAIMVPLALPLIEIVKGL